MDAHNHLMRANEYCTSMTREFRYHRDEAAQPAMAKDAFELEDILYGLNTTQEQETDWYND